jgi:hypothetical protein
VTKDSPFEVLQVCARLDSELFDQGLARGAVGLERFLLPTAAVEREHVPSAEALAVRLLGDQSFELGQDLAVPTQRKLGLVQELERAKPAIVEPRPLGLGHRLAVQVGQRRTTPQAQSRTELVGSVVRVAGCERVASSLHESLESLEVQFAALEWQSIAGAVGLDSLGAKSLPQAVDVDLKRLDRRARGVVSPELVDEPIA